MGYKLKIEGDKNMTNKELFKEISKMEQVMDVLLENSFAAFNNEQYLLLRYYFSQSNYEKMLEILTKEDK